jgi:hypothetical protein
MGLWIGMGVVLVVILGLAALGSWRRRGRSQGDLMADGRRDLTENRLRTRSRGRL